MNRILNSLVSLVVLFASSVAIAQEATPVAPKEECCSEFKIDWTASASLYSLNAGDILVIDNKFSTDLTKDLTVGIDVPVINNDNQSTGAGLAWQLNNGGVEESTTGFSDITFFFAYDLWDGKCSFLGKDTSVDLIGGVQAPIDGAYSSDTPVWYIGGIFGVTDSEWKVTQQVKYSFVDEYTFDPMFGGFVDGDIFALDTKFAYHINKNFDVGVQLNQAYIDGGNAILLGPCMDFAVSEKMNFNVGLGFAVSDDIPYDELNSVVGFKFGYQF
jgi:hypothetical protein